MLDRYVPERWTYRQLTVNYRTPTEIMAVAADVLTEVDPSLEPPKSVRSNGFEPWARRVSSAGLAAAVAEAVAALSAEVGTGSVAVIAPAGAELAGYDGAVLTPVTPRAWNSTPYFCWNRTGCWMVSRTVPPSCTWH